MPIWLSVHLYFKISKNKNPSLYGNQVGTYNSGTRTNHGEANNYDSHITYLYKYTLKSKQTRKLKFKKMSRDWSLLQKVRKQGIEIIYKI